MNTKRFASFVLILVTGLFLVGCTAPNNSNSGNTNTSTDYSGIDSGSNANEKPSGWPAAVPTVSGAVNFEYALLTGTYYLGYDVASGSVEQVTNTVKASLEQSGWSTPADSGYVSNEGSLYTFTKGNDSLTLAIAPSDDNAGKYQIAIVMGPQANSEQ